MFQTIMHHKCDFFLFLFWFDVSSAKKKKKIMWTLDRLRIKCKVIWKCVVNGCVSWLIKIVDLCLDYGTEIQVKMKLEVRNEFRFCHKLFQWFLVFVCVCVWKCYVCNLTTGFMMTFVLLFWLCVRMWCTHVWKVGETHEEIEETGFSRVV